MSVPQGAMTGSEKHDTQVTALMNTMSAKGWTVLSVVRGAVIGPVCITFVRD